MISLILPYWDRQEAANAAFALLDKHYRSLDLEIIVIDDGNRIPFVVPKTGLNVRVIRMPAKDKPTSPIRAWNEGVKAASGALIALSCVEILHDHGPVLQQMADEVRGKWDYVLAAAWCPEQQAWHCHSTVSVPGCPKGTGIGFLAMMPRYLFDAAGGFDEDYMQGAGYEDRDWINRLHRAGAHFVIRDDLVVTHPKRGASIAWEAEAFSRNARLFSEKWEQRKPVTFVCLKAGTAYGPEYVNILRDMVARNLSEGFPGRFVCITDDPTGLDDGIEVLPLPADLEKWWGKLYMFKRGLLPDGSRCVFMDLDTIIIGNLDAIASYEGQFATLRDFLFPQQVGPAIIAWEAGDFAASVWEEWCAQGKPRDPMGDLWWINNLDQGRFPKQIDILQDLYPGKFVSYKAGCKPFPPKGTAVVCFHGQPKPDNCGSEWVADVWRIGGGVGELLAISNTGRATVEYNVRSALKRNIPWLEMQPAHKGQVVIVAGGPSIEKTLPEIRWRRANGQEVWAVNGAAKWLNDRGITPHVQVVIDARPENAAFLTAYSLRQYVASQCAPQVFGTASNAIGFHLNTEGMVELLGDRQATLISSGSTVGLAAIALAYAIGYRAIHLHGFDSSFEDSKHAYPQRETDTIVDAVANGRRFKSTPWMVKQVQEFQELAAQLMQAGVVIAVAGDGLLPWVAQCMSQEEACSA